MKYQNYLGILILLISNPLLSQTETCLNNLDHPDNRIISQIVGSDTINREFILKLPANYNENIPTPLLLNFHGFGDCSSDYSETINEFYNFSDLADAENFIVAYPQGAYRPEKEDTYWEPGDTGIENIYENDVYFIDELISKLNEEFNLNMDMIYACGYSNGGMMTYSLACNRSNLFSAIGIMSGTMLQEDCTIENSIPIIKFHGIEDEVLPYEGNIWYQSVEEVINFWLDQNDIPAANNNTIDLNDGKVILDEYFNDNSACLKLYTINEEHDKPGAHVWFSDEIENLSPNEIMWNFFKDNCSTISSSSQIKEKEISVFPNPFKNHLTIKNLVNEEYLLKDLNGKLISKGRIASNTHKLNLENLKNGLYIISIKGQNKMVFKII